MMRTRVLNQIHEPIRAKFWNSNKLVQAIPGIFKCLKVTLAKRIFSLNVERHFRLQTLSRYLCFEILLSRYLLTDEGLDDSGAIHLVVFHRTVDLPVTFELRRYALAR